MRQSAAPPPAPPSVASVESAPARSTSRPGAMQDDARPDDRIVRFDGERASEPATTEHASDEIAIGESGAPATTAAGERPSEPERTHASEPSAMEPAAEDRHRGSRCPIRPSSQRRRAEAASDWMPPWSRPREPEPADESVASAAARVAVAEPPPGRASTPPRRPEPPASRSRRAEPDLVVTESMAELLLQQGHAAEALTVYRQLESRSGGEPRFAEKIAELERLAAPPRAHRRRPPRRSRSRSGAELRGRPIRCCETQGQSVQAFLRGVFGARLRRGVAGAAGHAEPTRAAARPTPRARPPGPAHDSLSLSSVFGEESTPTPPAVPSAGGGAPAGGVSYDEFFGARRQRRRAAPAAGPRSQERRSRPVPRLAAESEALNAHQPS